MFWNKKIKCPVTQEDKIWIEEKLQWIHVNMININKQPTILPTKRYFNINYSGVERDAYDTLEVVCQYFQVNPNRISLGFYDESAIELDRGMITLKEGDGTAGLYILDGDESTIMIEKEQLKKPNSLIATMAHEVSHYVIMEEKGYYFEDHENELLTDLTAIAYGFGIFMGNTKFSFNQWSSGDGWGGWSTSSQGYLPQQVIGYAMAEIQRRKDDLHPDWIQHLKKDFKKDVIKSLKFIKSELS